MSLSGTRVHPRRREGYYAADDVAPGERGEALTIGDGTEAWMFHILPDDTGAGAIWAAAKIPAGHVSVSANAFVIRGVPASAYDAAVQKACLFDAGDCDFVASTNLRAIATKTKGLLVETDAGDVDFAATYGPRNAAGDAYIYSTRRVWRVFSLLAPDATAASLEKTPMDYLGSELPWAIEVEKDITIEDVLALNRDHYEGSRFDMTRGLAAGPWGDPTRYDLTFASSEGACEAARATLPTEREAVDLGRFERAISMFRTTSSERPASRERGARVADGNALSRYSFAAWGPPADASLPVLWFAQGAPHAGVYTPLALAPAVTEAPAPLAVGNLFQVHAGSLWWATTKVANWMRVAGFAFAKRDVAAAQRALEAALADAVADATPETAQKANDAAAAAALDAWRRLFDKLVAKYRDGFALARSDVEVAVKKTFYPAAWLRDVGFFDPKHGYFADDGDQPFPEEVEVGGLRAPLVLGPDAAPGMTRTWLAVPAAVLGLGAAAFAGVVYGRAVERTRLLGAP